MKHFAMFYFGIFIIWGCSDASQDDWRTKNVKVNKTIRSQESVQAGQENLKGNAQIEFQSDSGSFQMNSTVEDQHYKDKTQFDDGKERQDESWGNHKDYRTYY